jgi:hypothetical protein
MSPQTFILFFVVILALVVAYFIYELAYYLSEKEMFIGKGKAGRIQVVVFGRKVCRWYMWVDDWSIGRKTSRTRKLNVGEVDPEKNWFNNHGLFWIGLWPWWKVYSYPLKKLDRVTTESGTKEFKLITATADTLFFQDQFVSILADIEIGGNMSVTLKLFPNFRILIGNTALFLTKDWRVVAEGILDDILRILLADKDYTKDVKGVNTMKLLRANPTEYDDMIKRLEEKCGVELIDCPTIQVEITKDPDGKMAEAQTALEIAKRNALAAIEKSTGEATSIRNVGTAEADVIKMKASAELEGEATGLKAIKDATGANGDTIILGKAIERGKLQFLGQGLTSMLSLNNEKEGDKK